MIIRAATPADHHRIAHFTVTDPVAHIDADRYHRDHARHQYRPEWTWIAEHDDHIVARALWWGRTDSTHPLALDCLHVTTGTDDDRATLATRLLTAGHDALGHRPQYVIGLPGTWRDDPATTAAVTWRTTAAHHAGLTDHVERLQYQWTPDHGVPTPSDRLTFTPEPDDHVILDVLRRIAVDTLDHHTRRALTTTDPTDQARDTLAFYRDCPGERDWWRLAHTTDGTLVGLTIPSATPNNRNVGYLGVLPEHRGHGHIHDLLAHITAFHAAAGADRVTATTDLANAPMAAAFDRAGYRTTETRLVLEA